MGDYSLVPVEHQPDFENVSLVPVEHDPFSADGLSLPAGTQPEGRSQNVATGTAPSTVSAPVADTPAAVGESHNRGSAVASAPSRTATENPKAAPMSSAPSNFSFWPAWGNVGAAMPEAYGAKAPIMDPLAKALVSAATLPQRAMDASGESFAHRYGPSPSTIRDSDVWVDPLIPIAAETAMMTMGTGAFAGAPIWSGEVLFGAGPVRRPLAGPGVIMVLLPFMEQRHLQTPPLELPLWAPVRGWGLEHAPQKL